MNIKKNDTVIVLSGKDKGVKGKVLVAMPAENKVIVEKVNVATCHTKPRRQGETGGIVKRARLLCTAKSAVRASASATTLSTARRSASARSAAPKSNEGGVTSWLLE